MKFIHVANFEKLQHYKFRNPPWIKLYKTQFGSKEFRELPLDAQAILTHLQVIASTCGNRIPYDVPWLRGKIGLPRKRKLDLSPLINGNWITVTNGASTLGTPAELWDYVLEYHAHYSSEFGWQYDAPEIDPRVERAVLSIGGWQRIADLKRRPKDAKFAKREFIDYFKATGEHRK